VASSLDGKDQVLWSQACHVDMIMMDLELEDEYYWFFADFSGSYKRYVHLLSNEALCFVSDGFT